MLKISKTVAFSTCSAAAILALQCAPAYAQAAPQPTEAEADSLADIVVTANKREQKLSDVGIAVAVVSGDALKNQQVNSLADLAQTIPSLTFANSANGTPVFTLRGIGFYETSIGSYPAVSVYVDEVPLSFPVLTRHAAFDLERVEVLKGPQGTLFGQNATGGALNYIAVKPTKDFKAGANLSYGSFNEIIGEGYLSGPLSENIQARLAGRIENAGGWQISNSRPNDRNGKVRNYMGRLQIAAQPSEAVRLLFSLSGSKDKSDTLAPQLLGLNIQNPITNPALTPALISPRTSRAADWTPGNTFGDNSMWQASLRADIDVSNDITLTSISSYVHYRQNQADEGDGVPLVTLDLKRDQGSVKSFSQELRLANASSNAFRWVVGGNYEKSTTNQKVDLSFPDSSSTFTLGAFFGYPISGAQYSTRQKFRNYAFFGNTEYDISDTLTLKLGGRYTNTRAIANACNRDVSGLPRSTGGFFFDVLLGGAFGRYTSDKCFIINNQGRTIGGIPNGAPGEYKETLQEDNISWRGGIDWKPRPGLLFYANVAKGYKAGSFPTVSSSTYDSYLPVKQESVLSYEAGFKASLIDRTLSVTGAGFYYDYTDKQIRSKLLALPFGILDVLQNIPKSTVKGFELEFSARPTQGLVINTAFTYIDAKIDRFTGINASGVSANFAGSDVPFTPKYQIGINADYEFPLSGSIEGFVGSSLNFRSKADSVIGGQINPPGSTPNDIKLFGIGDYALVDLRAGIKSSDGRWRASVWGKNVTNQYYWSNVVAAFDTIGRYTAKPATYGVSIGFKY
jgi:iron complex outermembrane recepter protein